MNDKIKGCVCIDCGHCSMAHNEYICNAPQLSIAKEKLLSNSCRETRANKNLCGTDGRWFLPNP